MGGKNFRTQKRKDLLPNSALMGVLKALKRNRFRDIVDLTNKTIVHSADPYSRGLAKTNLKEPMRFSRVEKIHKKLCQISNFLSVRLISGTYHESFLPSAQFNEVEFLDKSWIPQKELNNLNAAWGEYGEKVRGYGSNPPNRF